MGIEASMELFVAASTGGAVDVRTALEAGADPNERFMAGMTPLHIAAMGNENPAVVTALLDLART